MQVPLLQVEQRTDGGYDLCTQWWQEMNAIHHHNAITQLSFHKAIFEAEQATIATVICQHHHKVGCVSQEEV
jgi:hypothetical protein